MQFLSTCTHENILSECYYCTLWITCTKPKAMQVNAPSIICQQCYKNLISPSNHVPYYIIWWPTHPSTILIIMTLWFCMCCCGRCTHVVHTNTYEEVRYFKENDLVLYLLYQIISMITEHVISSISIQCDVIFGVYWINTVAYYHWQSGGIVPDFLHLTCSTYKTSAHNLW